MLSRGHFRGERERGKSKCIILYIVHNIYFGGFKTSSTKLLLRNHVGLICKCFVGRVSCDDQSIRGRGRKGDEDCLEWWGDQVCFPWLVQHLSMQLVVTVIISRGAWSTAAHARYKVLSVERIFSWCFIIPLSCCSFYVVWVESDSVTGKVSDSHPRKQHPALEMTGCWSRST